MSLEKQNNKVSETHKKKPDYITGDVASGLKRIRSKLLDLTNRNKLINFRHTKVSTLRIIDELPDQLFLELLNGKTFVFDPIPRPTPDQIKEFWLKKKQLDPELKIDPRELPPVEEYAASIGIDTRFEVPLIEEEGESKKHKDLRIQTLQYPERLEAILKKISSTARSAIEETGSNMLYLIFGFLEWYEDENSSKKHWAPLIHVPVILEKSKTARGGQFSFEISYSGEDITTNLSLKEKLSQDFGIALPDLSEEEEPEAYFEKVRKNMENKPRWQIRRCISLSLLHFGKLLLFLDLDPKRWPETRSILDHDLLLNFFSGRSSERGSSPYAEEYDLDELTEEIKGSPIIYDADSSQHSALLDVLEGKNLVIEGPPGTGKSQTITNIIASALYQNKSVLFVAEKLAALEVVRRRLNSAGLGDFCLELHSHKTQKRKLLDDLGLRLKKRGHFKRPHEIEKKLNQLEDYKKRLKDHVSFINSPCGSTGLTYHQVFTASARYQEETSPWQEQRDEIFAKLPWLKSVSQKSSDDDSQDSKTSSPDLDCKILDEIEDQSSAFLIAREGVLQDFKKITDHPWYWVNVFEFGRPVENKIVERFEGLATAIKNLMNEVHNLEREIHYKAEKTEESFATLARMENDLVLPSKNSIWTAFPFLRNEKNLENVKSWRSKIIQFNDLLSTFEDCYAVKGKDFTEKLRILRKSIKNLESMFPKNVSFSDSKEIEDLLGNLLHTIKEIEKDFSKNKMGLKARLSFSFDGAQHLYEVIEIFSRAPIEALDSRSKSFEKHQFQEILIEASEKHKSLVDQKEGLTKHFHLDLCPDRKFLKEAAAVVETANFLSFFDKEWRSARKLHKKLRKTRGFFNNDKVAKDFYALYNFKKSEKAFLENAKYKTFFVENWKGLETNFDNLNALFDWLQTLKQALEDGPYKKHIFNYFNLTSEIISEIAVLKSSTFWQGLEQISDIYRVCQEHLKPNVIDQAKPFKTSRKQIESLHRKLEVSNEGIQQFLNDKAKSIKELSENLDIGEQAKKALEIIEKNSVAKEILGKNFEGVKTKEQVLTNLDDTISFVEGCLNNGNFDGELKQRLLDKGNEKFWMDFPKLSNQLRTLFETYKGEKEKSAKLCGLDERFWMPSSGKEESLDVILKQLEKSLNNKELLTVWLKYQRTKEELEKKGLKPLIRLVEEGSLPESAFIPSIKFFFFHDLGCYLKDTVQELKRFNSFEQIDIKKKFIQLDKEILELYRQAIASNADSIPVVEGWNSSKVKEKTELHLLEHEIGKTKRHIPIRQLVLRSGQALKSLKPCFMMGPLSVAQYLKPGDQEFDIVIMDEASQMKPENALGAIARGKQVVVVGDSNQLPPTDFFNRVGADDESEDEENYGVAEDTESILEAAGSLFKPARRLRWHYRSKHQSLIAFSNKHFYENDLVVFPSSRMTGPRLGVSSIYVPKATCQKGRNQIEAETVAQHAISFMEDGRKESLGIAAMNIAQANLIRDEFDKLYKESPAAQEFCELREDGAEPFFIKNLENVQGDERDVIFISFTYGPDPETGKVYQRFGPINLDTGWRRLNVLYSRAKRQVVAFTSMKSSDVIAGPNSSLGAHALKHYLEYATTGILEVAEETEKEPDSDFEITVMDALKKRGYKCIPQVGSAGFFIDIGVRHPDRGDSFLAGIECDGAAYHSGKTVRDRDRLRQEILENLGWRIFRIWSTDWFDNPGYEIKRVCKFLEELHKRDQQKAARLEDVARKPAPKPLEEDIELTLEDLGLEEKPPKKKQTKAKFGISVEEAREKLIGLRENNLMIDFPDSDPSKSLLRNEMVDALLEHLPYDNEEFLETIPQYLRSNIGPGQFKKYFPKVLEILEQVQED